MESIKNFYANWTLNNTVMAMTTSFVKKRIRSALFRVIMTAHHIHVKAWKFMVMEWIFACSLCTSLIISLLFMWLVLVLDIVRAPAREFAPSTLTLQEASQCIHRMTNTSHGNKVDTKNYGLHNASSHLNITENWWVALPQKSPYKVDRTIFISATMTKSSTFIHLNIYVKIGKMMVHRGSISMRTKRVIWRDIGN